MITEAGTYTARAGWWEIGLVRAGTHEQIAVEFTIVEEGPFKGQKIVWYGQFTEKATPHTIKALRACGWSSDDIDKLDGFGSYLVSLVVEMEEATEGKNAGKLFPRVKWVNQLGGSGSVKLEKPLDAGARKMFAAKMRMHAKQVPVVSGGTPASPADRAVTEKGDEEKEPPF